MEKYNFKLIKFKKIMLFSYNYLHIYQLNFFDNW